MSKLPHANNPNTFSNNDPNGDTFGEFLSAPMEPTHKTLTLQCPHCDCQKNLWVETLEDRIEPFFCCRAYDVDIRDGKVVAWKERRIRAGRRIPESQAIVCEEDWHNQFAATFANYDGPGDLIGTGKDPQEAIRDLLDQVEV